MIKGKGKCIVCGCDEIAEGKAMRFTSVCEDISDYKYFENIKLHVCTNCGFTQLTSVFEK